MAFGYNRYALVLAMLTVGSAIGCGSDSKSRGSASTVAPATSGSTSPTTSSTTPLGNGPALFSVAFEDADQNKMVSKGDKVLVTFAGEIAPINTTIDATTEFDLAVAGDSFGTDPIVRNGTQPTQVEIVLGDNAVLNVSGSFDLANTTPGSASAVNVAIGASAITGIASGSVQAAAAPMDIVGQLPAGFMPAGSLVIARGGHASVALDDGRVLAIGGISGGTKASNYVTEAELYDPVTGTFTLVSDLSGDKGRMKRGSVKVGAVAATAVKLQDGRVLVCGGYGVEKKGWFGLGKAKVDTLESAFLFDPADNTFTRVGDMNYSRHSHTATIMDDGRVLIAGGYNDSLWSKDKTQAPFEIFDPAKKAFEKSGSIFSRFKSVEPRMDHTATAIEGGTGILLSGGNYYKGGYLFGLVKPKLQMCKGSETVRGTKTDRAGDLNQARMNHAATAISSREVVIAGGHDLSSIVSSIEVFNSASGQWSAAGSLAKGRTGCQLASTQTQTLVIGGTDGVSEVATVEVFDNASKTLGQASYSLATARNAFTATTLKDGRILVIGGMAGATKSLDGIDGQALASCEVFVNQ